MSPKIRKAVFRIDTMTITFKIYKNKVNYVSKRE